VRRDAALLTRKPHPVHGRLLQLELTDRGAALLKTCKYRVAAIKSKMTAHLPPSGEALVRRWLVSLAKENG
jgi:DNA-binding MarR family transcriptional regulator